MLERSFDPAAAETRLYDAWEASGAFQPSGDPGAEAYTIVIPPPNVTGTLHMGHALNNTLQDVLVRFERMRGRSVLWQPGTDHAGIATQMVVERQLMERQAPSRREMGREAFLNRVWEWKAESGGAITRQLRRLGASCDWSRERFTMDEGLSAAVRKVFVQLYREGLIYRAKRLVNWDPKLETAISDLEVENTEVDGHMWHFKYPLAGGKVYEYVEKDQDGNVTLRETRDYISIATTRPETMLGDGAVAVHPSDERYAPIVGALCQIPVGPKEHRRLIPIITDEYPDPKFGSGAVKITGGHDFNDYQVAKRGGIPMYRLMDMRANMRADGAPYAEEAAKATRLVKAGGTPDASYVDAINLVPDEYRGLDRYEARERVVADIDAEGLMIKVEDKKIMQPFGDRSGVVIEPMLTDQWFVDAEALAKPAIAAVEKGETRFVPEAWTKTYFQWMRNIEPWCVSRQLWWGHQIPAWYGPPRGDLGSSERTQTFVGETEADVIRLANEFYGADINIRTTDTDDPRLRPQGPLTMDTPRIEGFIGHGGQDGNVTRVTLNRDADVLDTWFSSALWPFSTLGWPEGSPLPLAGEGSGVRASAGRHAYATAGGQAHATAGGQAHARALTPDPSPVHGRGETQPSLLHTHYPTSVLVTAFDIIFFWVARMMMMGLHFMKDVPFKDVYIHALVLDEKGQKMSKSKGNVIDPLVLIDKYGADALRFTLAAQAAQGRNIRLSEARVEGYRNFATKLWNAARFCEMNECVPDPGFDPASANDVLNRWIVHEANACARDVADALEEYRFNDAAGAVYKFTWNVFCDWYVELAKPLLFDGAEAVKTETRLTAAWTLDQILKLLHPFMPFVTEALWEAFGPRETMLISAAWPAFDDRLVDDISAAEMNWTIGLITAIRSVRAEMNVPAGAKTALIAVGLDPRDDARLAAREDLVVRLARLSAVSRAAASPKGAIQIVHEGAVFALPLAGVIDIAAEKSRLEKEIARAADEVAKIDKKLSNQSFVDKAPAEVVEEQRVRRADYAEQQEKFAAALARLKDL